MSDDYSVGERYMDHAGDYERITRPARVPLNPDNIVALREGGLRFMDAPSHEDVLAWKAAYYVQNDMNPHQWVSFRGRERKIAGLGTVEVVDVKEDTREDEYGEFMQGSTADASIVFKVTHDDGTVTFLVKGGEYDSYGDSRYEGGIHRVTPRVKTVTIYEW